MTTWIPKPWIPTVLIPKPWIPTPFFPTSSTSSADEHAVPQWWVRLATVRTEDVCVVAGDLDLGRVAAIAETVAGRGVCMPVLVEAMEGGRWRVADGRHRYLAHLARGRDWLTVLELLSQPAPDAWPLWPDLPPPARPVEEEA